MSVGYQAIESWRVANAKRDEIFTHPPNVSKELADRFGASVTAGP